MSAHPALHVDLRMADERQDLIIEGVDVAFRFGQLKDSNATATMLGRCPRMLVASPDYWPARVCRSSPTISPTILSS